MRIPLPLDGKPSPASNESGPAVRRKVLILYTGGTMGMMFDDQGGLAPKAGYLTKVIQEMPENQNESMPRITVSAFDSLIDSACMGPRHWVQIAETLERNYFTYDGFVVITGTDTMAYAASALSFMLENLGKPVVFTGSQIPLSQVYNDAHRNLIVSIIFAGNSEFPEVCVCFNDKILRANRATKIDSVGLNAFHSPNFPPLATLGARIQQNVDLVLPPPRGALKVHKKLESAVVVVKLVPGFDDDSIEAMIEHSKSLKAMVVELYGMGNGPSKTGFVKTIEKARAKGILVVALTQCARGGVSLGAYSIGREFVKAGVISGEDMTTEACTTKLSYLIGRLGNNIDVITESLTRSIRGELTPKAERGRSLMESLQVNQPILSKL